MDKQAVKLHIKMASETSAHSNYCVKVSYTKHIEEHDGSCSGTFFDTEFSKRSVPKKKYYDLHESIRKEDICEDRSLRRGSRAWELYEKKTSRTNNCRCGCEKRYEYHSMVVKPRVTFDDLD